MNEATRQAERVARRHGRDPWQIADQIKLSIHEVPFPRHYRELYVGGTPTMAPALAVASNADRVEARALLAHGLGHHFLHVGNRFVGRQQPSSIRVTEEEAENFAACLLIPEGELVQELQAVDPPSAWELSLHFAVPEGLVERRLRLLGRSERLTA